MAWGHSDAMIWCEPFNKKTGMLAPHAMVIHAWQRFCDSHGLNWVVFSTFLCCVK